MHFNSLFGLPDIFHIQLSNERYICMYLCMYVCMYPDDDRDSGWNISEMNNMW